MRNEFFFFLIFLMKNANAKCRISFFIAFSTHFKKKILFFLFRPLCGQFFFFFFFLIKKKKNQTSKQVKTWKKKNNVMKSQFYKQCL